MKSGIVRIGRVDDGKTYYADPASYLNEALRVRGSVRHGAAEQLLAELERGELDIVMGLFADDSPWKERVHFAKRHWGRFRFATRNGEHRWSMQVERAVEDLVQ